MGCCNSAESKHDWKPLEQRRCTDVPWLIIFALFCGGMLCICGFTIATGGASRLISGYDSYGNICGQDNAKIDGIELSGRDQVENKYVFFLDPCNIDFINRKVKSLALCVHQCPEAELTSYKDLHTFAMTNGSYLCSYDIYSTTYNDNPERSTKCPKLPVLPSKPVPGLHRCVPADISCVAEMAQAFVTFLSDNDSLNRVISSVLASKGIIMGLCLLSLVLSLILMVIIRYISTVLVWILTVLVIIGSIGGTGVLWWLYADQKKALSDHTASVFGKEVTSDNVQALLVYAIIATVLTVILLLVIFFMRKRVALTIALFHVAGKVFLHLPLLALQPFWTFLSLMLFWVCWIATLLFLGVSEKIC